MADRTVTVTIKAAFANYLSGMEKVSKATDKASSAQQKLEKQSAAMEKAGKGLLTYGAAAAAAVGLILKATADFDAQMAQVQSLSHAGAVQMDQLRNAALTLGQGIGFSATQVADAETELTKAGVSVTDQLNGGLKGALDLAAAGQMDVADATSIAASAMTQFGLKGKDVPHIADLLAAGADKALGSVQDLGQGLKYVGPVAASMGVSIDQTVGTLSELAQNGILADQAGTSLRGMLQSLTSPSQQAKKVMQEYGISVYDAQGHFVGFDGVAQQLQTHLGGLTQATKQQALGQIFGNEQITAATVLMKDGAKGVDSWTQAVNDNGFAAEQAAGKMNSLKGDLSKLKAAFQSGVIETGEDSTSGLRGTVQTITNVIEGYNNLSGAGKNAILIIASVTGGLALMGGGFLTLVPKIAAAKEALIALKGTSVSIGGVLGKGGLLALGLTEIAAGLTGLASKGTLAADELASVDSALKLNNISQINKLFTGGGGAFDAFAKDSHGVKDALDQMTSSLGKTNIDAGKTFDGMTFGLTHVSDTAKRFAAQFDEIGSQLGSVAETSLPTATKSFNELVQAAGGGNEAASKLISVMPDYKAELIKLAAAANITLSKQDLLNLAQGKGTVSSKLLAAAAADAGDSNSELAQSMGQTADSSENAAQKVQDVSDALKGLTSPTLDARSAARDYQAALDDMESSLKQNGKTLDITTDKGRSNQAALDNIAQSAENLAGALYTQTGSQQQATNALSTGRADLIKAAEQYGMTTAQAAAYADQVLGTPKDWATKFTADTGGASANVQSLQQRISGMKGKTLYIDASTGAAQYAIDGLVNRNNGRHLSIYVDAQGGKSVQIAGNTISPTAKAAGGPIYGPGSGTSDSIPAWLSNGEFVVKAKSVQKYGVGFLNMVNAGAFADGGLVASATARDKAAKTKLQQAKNRQRKLQSEYNKHKKSATIKAQLEAAQAATRQAQRDVAAADKALAAAKAAPTGSTLEDRLQFRSSVRAGSYDASNAVSDLYSMGEDSSKYGARQRASFLTIANKQELAMLKLQKASTSAAAAVSAASDKLDGLKQSSAQMSSGISSNLSGSPLSGYRTGAGLAYGLTSRATQLKAFQGLLISLQKKGVSPALLNEIASVGLEQGLPLARSLNQMNGQQLQQINSQYKSVNSTADAIGKQVANANYSSLIKTAERQLASADKNADKITAAINAQSKALQKIVGKALGLPGYASGGYTGDFSPSARAGFVHGREFVVNAAATARNRTVLEAINAGGTIRYSAPAPVMGSGSGQRAIEQHNHFAPVVDLDPRTVSTIMGRETARRLAGVLQ